MNKCVRLVASGINVTAANAERAERYMREDASEFRRDWTYEEVDVMDTREDVTDAGEDAVIEVEVDDCPGRGDRIWRGRATFEVVVPATSDRGAVEAARSMLAG